jgi:prophage antirepressor-like protein
MNELQVFQFEGEKVRVINQNGEPWWVLKDVCYILNLSDVSMTASRLDEDEKGTSQICTLGGDQKMTIINESGLYNVILRSDKPDAKRFRKWITSEVLPAIRKTGSYSIFKVPKTLAEALYLAADLEEKRAILEAKVEKDAPKLEEHDVFINSEDDECITVAMKAFPHLQPKNDIFPFLRTMGYVVGKRRVIPSSLALKEDYMIQKNVLGKDGVTFFPEARVQNRQLPKWRTELIPRIEKWKARRDSKD